MADNEIEISVVLDDGSIKRGFAKIRSEGEDASSKVSNSFATLTKQLAGLAAAYLSVKAVGSFLSSSISEAAQGADSVNRLTTSLKLAGRFSEETRNSFTNLADELQKTTRFSDDQVLAVATLANNYARSAGQAKELTKAAIDLSVATGVDAETALRQLGGTLSGVTGLLSKQVPELKTLTEAQLKSGDAIAIVANRFKGAALADVQTYSGALAQLGNVYADLKKTIGGFVTSSPAVVATIKFISESISSLSAGIKNNAGGSDLAKDLIINFSVIAQAGIETGRRIGLSFELAFLRAQQALLAFKVLSTAGLSDAFNQQLASVLTRIEEVKQAFSQDSAATIYFDTLIQKLADTNGKLKEFAGPDGGPAAAIVATNQLSGAVESVAQANANFVLGFSDQAMQFAGDAKRAFQDQGAAAFKALAGGVTSGMAAIGKALVTGENLFKAFAGALLGALGQALVAEGGARILQGLARAFGSYGLDPTAQGLIATGSAMTVAGGALQALGTGGGGASIPTGGGGGGGGYTGGQFSSDTISPDQAVKEPDQQRVVVNVQGDVLDSRDTGLRIVEILNDAFNSSGAKVVTA